MPRRLLRLSGPPGPPAWLARWRLGPDITQPSLVAALQVCKYESVRTAAGVRSRCVRATVRQEGRLTSKLTLQQLLYDGILRVEL